MLNLDTLDFDKQNGLVTVVAQDAATGRVLMLAHADRAALERTMETGEMHYLSRTRGPWHKGATSGNVQRVVSLSADCDGDAVLALVRPAGPACHTGAVSCFGEASAAVGALAALDRTIAERAGAGAGPGPGAGRADSAVGDEARGAPPERQDRAAGRPARDPSSAAGAVSPLPTSYTRRLLDDRNLRLKKLGEEAAELVLACADEDRPRAAEEAADLVYHTLVALRAVGLGLDDALRVLDARSAPRG